MLLVRMLATSMYARALRYLPEHEDDVPPGAQVIYQPVNARAFALLRLYDEAEVGDCLYTPLQCFDGTLVRACFTAECFHVGWPHLNKALYPAFT